jgi:hypothetical protein
MKRLAVLAMLGLGACSADGTVTAWRLDRFLDRPDEARFNAVLKSARACQVPRCPQSESLTAAHIDRLTARMRQGNPYAVRLALASFYLIGDSAGANGPLARHYGPTIRTQPEAFLDAALTEECLRPEIVTTTPESMLDNDTAQYEELVARRAALMSVTRPYLQPIRDFYVAALDPAIEKADRARFRTPAPLS